MIASLETVANGFGFYFREKVRFLVNIALVFVYCLRTWSCRRRRGRSWRGRRWSWWWGVSTAACSPTLLGLDLLVGLQQEAALLLVPVESHAVSSALVLALLDGLRLGFGDEAGLDVGVELVLEGLAGGGRWLHIKNKILTFWTKNIGKFILERYYLPPLLVLSIFPLKNLLLTFWFNNVKNQMLNCGWYSKPYLKMISINQPLYNIYKMLFLIFSQKFHP